jgi:hypothetical protein
MKPLGRATADLRGTPQGSDQLIDRDHEHVSLNALDTASTDEAQNRNGPIATPPAPSPNKPGGLHPHPDQVPLLITPGLRLDHHRDSGWRDRDRVDITRPLPPQRVVQPPALAQGWPMLAEPGPLTGHRPDCGRPARPSGGRRGRGREQGSTSKPRATSLRRSRSQARAAQSPRSLMPAPLRGEGVGAAGGARSSLGAFGSGTAAIRHPPMLPLRQDAQGPAINASR